MRFADDLIPDLILPNRSGEIVSLDGPSTLMGLTPERVRGFLEDSDQLSEHELMAQLIHWVRREVKPKKSKEDAGRKGRRKGPGKKEL